MLKAPKTSNRVPLKTGGLTSQTKRAVDKKPSFIAAGAPAPISQIATTPRATDILNVDVTQTVTIQSDEKKSSGGRPTATESTKGALARFDNLVESSKKQQTPNFPPPKQDSSVQIKADIYNADPEYFDVKLRPEILLLSQFKPLYNSSQDNLTEEGQLFELQVSSLRNTESDANNLLKQTIGESGIQESNDKFKSQITVLRDNLQNLDSFIKKIGTYKSSLNIATDNRYKFTPGKFIETNLLNSKDVINGFYTFNGSDISYDLIKALIEARSIDSKAEIDAIKLFSSSKLFLICINELNKMIKTHSYGILKKKIKDSLISDVQDDTLYSLTKKYSLVSLSENQDSTIGSSFPTRLSVSSLTSGITKFSDLFVDTGTDRFKKIESLINSTFKNDYDRIGAIFHICFKDLIQKVRFELNKKDSSIKNRVDVLDSFIGYYPVEEKPVYAAAESKENIFTGDKLSDLVFFGNLNDLQQKVLMLENGSSNVFPTSIASGEDYLFSSGTGNAENFLTTSTYRIDRVRDFKSFLDKISNQAFENLVDLGAIPLDDATASSIGKGFTSLSSVNAFYQLFNSLVLQQNLSTGRQSLKFNLPSPVEIDKSGEVKGSGNLKTGAKFTENDLIALFTYSPSTPGPISVSTISNKTYTLHNLLYSYIYHRAVGGESSDPNFVKQVSGQIVNILFDSAKSIQDSSDTGNVKIKLKKIIGYRDDFQLVIESQLRGSVFIDKIVSFFKQFLSFEDLLPTFFYAILLIIKHTSPVKVNDVISSPQKSADFITLYTSYDNRFPQFISEDLAKFSYGTSSAVSYEMTKIFNLTFSILNTIQTLNKNITSTLNELQAFDQTIPNYLLRYLNNDEKKLSILFKEPQLMLLLSTVEDVYQSYTNFSTENADKSRLFIKKEETLPHSTKIVELLRNYFSDAEFCFNKGYNKQIISVGIPHGLLKNLNEILKIKNSKNVKHDDIFRILVYKMDLLNPFIIYKPKKFIFEASRFVDRVYSDIANVNKNIAVYNTIPTRNYSLYTDPNLIKEGNPYLGTDLSNAFGNEYDFLSKEEKEQILENHTTSFLLENYLRLFSGLNLNELTFNLSSPQEISAIYNSLIDINIEKTKTLASQKATQENLVAAYRKTNAAGVGLEKAAAIAIPDPDPYISKLLQPKRFDRVFNIIFDPEFEVDYNAITLNLATDPSNVKSSVDGILGDRTRFKQDEVTTTKYKDIDKGPQDIAMNTYFVSIGTHATVSK
jgi:hypothetical protein